MSKVFLSFFFPKTRFSKQDNTTFHAFEHVAKRKFFFLVHSFIFCQSFASFFFWQNQKSEHLRKKTFESVAFFTEDLLRKRRKKRSTHCFFYCWCQHLFKKPGSFFSFLWPFFGSKAISSWQSFLVTLLILFFFELKNNKPYDFWLQTYWITVNCVTFFKRITKLRQTVWLLLSKLLNYNKLCDFFFQNYWITTNGVTFTFKITK